MLATERRVHPSGQFQARDLGDEYLFYDPQNDRVHVLNGTARAIYVLCDGTRTRDDIVREFARLFEIDEQTARTDSAETIDRLLELGLIRLA